MNLGSSNPVFKSLVAEGSYESSASYTSIIVKTVILFAIAIIGGISSIFLFPEVILNPATLVIFAILGFLSVLVGCMSRTMAPACSVIYAYTEGVFLVLSSILFEAIYPGIIPAALAITAAIFCTMLFLYATNIIKVTAKFRRFMFNAMLSIFVCYALVFVVYLINPNSPIVAIFSGEMFGVAVVLSLVIIIFASLRLTVDFERIKQTAEGQMGKGAEWQAAMGLMVSIVWIYIEVVRLLAIIASKKD